MNRHLPPPPATSPSASRRQADLAAGEVLSRIRPTVASEATRRAVIAYLQRLIQENLGVKVFPFGSVPLKTYLPDGDIDLTAVGGQKCDGALATDVCSVLKAEEHNKYAEFEVKDVQYIHAEVKLVKCLVQKMVVDISFNQIGGLCTLCFLEQIASYIGKDHLFKQSIILIKAWCYYESRILGAHHALLSTYALESLVLYIILHFRSCLDAPLWVLYKFLDYFSKFDWDNYCISAHGPISLHNLPELVVELPDNEGSDLLFSKEFLKWCIAMFSIPMKGPENSSQVFPQKYLNIIDPLRGNNNLGRSVSKSNFYRIRSAFAYGARKLGEILLLPQEFVATEVKTYFMNTLDRQGSRNRPDVISGFCGRSNDTLPEGNFCDSMPSDLWVEKGKGNNLTSRMPSADTHGTTSEESSRINISSLEKEHVTRAKLWKHHQTANCMPIRSQITPNGSMKENSILTQELSTRRALDSRTVKEFCEFSSSNKEPGASPSGRAHHTPFLSFIPENGIRNDGINCNSFGRENRMSVTRNLAPVNGSNRFLQLGSYKPESPSSGTSWFSKKCWVPASSCLLDGLATYGYNASVSVSDNAHLAYCSTTRNKVDDTNIIPASSSLLDLTGDYDMHYGNLIYARCCQGCSFGDFTSLAHQQSWGMHAWEAKISNTDQNGVSRGLPFLPSCYRMNSPISDAYRREDILKQQVIGTNLPNKNYVCYVGSHPIKIPGNLRSPSEPLVVNSGCLGTLQDSNLPEKRSDESDSQDNGCYMDEHLVKTEENQPYPSETPRTSNNGCTMVSPDADLQEKQHHEPPSQDNRCYMDEDLVGTEGNQPYLRESLITSNKGCTMVSPDANLQEKRHHERSPQDHRCYMDEHLVRTEGNQPYLSEPLRTSTNGCKMVTLDADLQEKQHNEPPPQNYWNKERRPARRVRNTQSSSQLSRASDSDSLATMLGIKPETGCHEPPRQGVPIHNVNGCMKPLLMKTLSHSDGFVSASYSGLKSDSSGSVQLVDSPLKYHKPSKSITPQRQDSSVPPTSTMERLGDNSNSERAMQTYQLKDDDDFPPLSR